MKIKRNPGNCEEHRGHSSRNLNKRKSHKRDIYVLPEAIHKNMSHSRQYIPLPGKDDDNFEPNAPTIIVRFRKLGILPVSRKSLRCKPDIDNPRCFSHDINTHQNQSSCLEIPSLLIRYYSHELLEEECYRILTLCSAARSWALQMFLATVVINEY